MTPAQSEPVPGYGLFATADGGQVALGVVNEQHFWSVLCDALGLSSELARLGFAERCRRGGELQRAIGAAVATRDRDELVAALAAAGVPVAPVLDRAGMLARAPFPTFPIRLPLPEPSDAVPALDQHRGEGFRPAPDSRCGAPMLLRCGRLTNDMTQISDLLAANQGYAAARANVADRARGAIWPSSPAWTPASTCSPSWGCISGRRT